jgi:hypothetical protein
VSSKPSRPVACVGLASAILLFAVCMAVLFRGSREYRQIGDAKSDNRIAARR